MTAPLLLLPLDDRPVNLDFPLLLANVAGERLLTPDPALLGRFLDAGDSDALAAWLLHSAPAARALLISLDMLAYGGLVASRTPTVSATQALHRLQVLREIKHQHPDIHIYAFNVIMRLTITGADAETRAAGRDIFRYSVLADQATRLGDAQAAQELAEVEARIPRRLLDAYLGARARNHAVNRAALDMLADGVLDYLALVQEDTAPAGLHIAEQHDLQTLARERVQQERWRLYPGTDEAAMTLLARYLLNEAGLAFPAAIVLRDAVAAQTPALFEDIPLVNAVQRHLDAVGGTQATTGTPIAVHTFTPPQPDLFEMTPLPSPTWDAALATYPDHNLAEWVQTLWPKPIAMADVAYCNGGDPHLIEALLANQQFWSLESYAGWNTAGNTLGTTLAHAALRVYARSRGMTPAMESAHQTALCVRLLDDGLYQSVIRAWAIRRAEENNFSPLNLTNNAPIVEEWVNTAMHELWHELQNRHPDLSSIHRPFHARLPWGRLFEVRISFD
ncbi:MAG TPA: DUF4127 family protein [Armatimonadota bacterium]|nr:DUF4127 family protein [Armatimonadota bacterium]